METTTTVDLETAERLAERYEPHGVDLQVILNCVGGMPEPEARQIIEWAIQKTHSPPAALGSWAEKNRRRAVGTPNHRRRPKDNAKIKAATAASKRAHQECEAVREALAALEAERDGTSHEEYLSGLEQRDAESRKWRSERPKKGRRTLAEHREFRRHWGAKKRLEAARARPRENLEQDLGCKGGECGQELTAYLEEAESLAAYAERRMSEAGASYYEIYQARGFARYAREESA